MRVAVFGLIGLLMVLALPACERWEDPRRALRKATGGEPLNQIAAFGRGPMPFNRVLNLPECEASLNGELSCRLVLDTGAGDMLILTPHIAEQLGLKAVSDTQLSGLGGVVTGGMTLLEDLAIGDIRVERVVTIITSESSSLALIGDGVLGTGVLRAGRVKLDFEQAELAVSPSSADPGIGEEVAIHLSDSAHIFTSVLLQSVPATAMLDSGANQPIFSSSWLEQNYPDHPNVDLELPLPRFALGVKMGTPGITTCANLEFAGREIENVAGMALADVDLILSSQLEEKIGVVIGMTIFREMKSWTVDFPRARMWVDWLEPP